jgi:hypothetical protein
VFGFKRVSRHKGVTARFGHGVVKRVWVVVALIPFAAGCLQSPQRVQSVELLDQLVDAREKFGQQQQQACDVVGNVQTRLYGEPGLTNVQPAWANLRDAADALQAVCGQSTLLAQAFNDSPATRQARQRWQQGIQREVGIACDHLRNAAAALDRAAPC